MFRILSMLFLGNRGRSGSRFGRAAYGRRASGGFMSNPLARMALGGLATYAARRYMNRRRPALP